MRAALDTVFAPLWFFDLTNQHRHHASPGNEPRAGVVHLAKQLPALAVDTTQARQIDLHPCTWRSFDDLVPARLELVNPRARQLALEREHQLAVGAACCNPEHRKSPSAVLTFDGVENRHLT